MKLLLLILCFSAHLYAASALSSDGFTLLSLLNHWAVVSPPINSSWKFSDSTPCSWVGVQCNHDGNVVSLNLTASGITGELGPEIGNLSHLQTLVLLTNDLTGGIPPELGNCSMLEYIDLSENHFQSQIPYTLKKLQNLRFMSFSSNMLYGNIPESLFHITYLEEVYLYDNYLSGSIPSNIGNCSNLKALLLNDNRLEGILPQSLSNLKKLFTLDLSFNVFSGGIPSGLGNCNSLAKFAAMNSNLVGIIPSSLGLLLKLSILLLSENHLSGKIPPEIGNCESLIKLHLYSNQLVGEIPHELGRLSKLQDLELNFNRLTGEIPLSIWQIQSLQHILVHNNSLSGKLPQVLTELKHLKNLSLFDNQFSGIIPQSLGINSSLVKVDLMNNKFTGNIPPNLCFGKQLRALNLGVNQLQGGIPHDVGRCATLGRLTLNENNLSGSLPEFESNQNLKYMDISRNKISGAIPSSLGKCTSITALILSVNMISGIIPSELGNLVNLQVLNLALNILEGPLPQQLSYCTKMEKFDVGFNFLNGSLPSSFRNWTGLTTLILRENCFSGGIPSFLSEFDLLLELQLGGNMFGGEIPKSIGAMQNLLYGLNLSANRFRGEVPLEIGKLKKLQSLDVSRNDLTGSIHVLDELSSLIEVNISYNSFVGPVPNWLMQFLNSSPSSFFGNPGLCVSCSNCNKTSYLMPCEKYKSTKHQNISEIVILIIGLGSSMLVAFLLVKLIHIHLSSQRSKENAMAKFEVQEPLFCGGVRGHRIIDLIYKHRVMRATKNLNDQYIIARGAHGIVYKAELFHFGAFAVKKLFTAPNGRKRLKMPREIEISRNLKHQYVARCLGSWIGKDYSLVFYRYMENGSLHDVLHENPPPSLVWNDRYNIAVGVAKGLAYLHHGCNPPILHRDIKPKNILLDSDMNPYITDFGLAIALDQTSGMKLLRSTYNLGTPGFMAPEMATSVVASCKFDIYSYGVVLLELVTRKKVLDPSFLEETTLVKWFHSKWSVTRDIEEIVDSSFARELRDLNVVRQVIKVLLVALICTYKDPEKRLNMEDVIKIYEAPTIQGIFVLRDRTSFHLGRALAAAVVESIYLQVHEEPWPLSAIGKNRILDLRYKREVMKATENLNDRYIVGRGAHGFVYKAELDDLGVVAVKRHVLPGNKRKRLRMLREIEIMKNLRHQYVASYLGYWIEKEHCLIFFKYMENGSLHDVLHENDAPPSLEWTVRYKIAVGVAQGLAYLHHGCHPPILHRDIKPKNILLDSDMEPCITDFGIAIALDQFSAGMHLPSTYHIGTCGYMAPEIAYAVVPSCELDVFSYGVVLLELITRKKVLDSSFEEEETTLVGWFRSVWREAREIEEIVDSSLARELSDLNVKVQVIKMLLVALMCTEKDPGKRPKMEDVIKIYEATTIEGIYVQRGTFHLGRALAASARSIYMQLARTIVIKGLPKDVKQRELPNLLRWLPGYEASKLNFMSRRPEGYALFNTAQQAIAAKDILQDLLFDARTKSVLHTEMADKHYFVIRVKHDDDVRSIDEETNSELVTNTSKSIQQNFSSSGAYDRGKRLLTAEDYSQTGWEMHGNMASRPILNIPYACLHDVLHVQNPLRNLKWNVRYKIAVGIAHELAYLHHDCDPPLVPQDLNSKNIFLDSDMEPHICQFGVSMPMNPSSSPAGEPSGIVPVNAGTLTENKHRMVEAAVASDVHDYGLVLLELLTKKKVFDSSLWYKPFFLEQVRSAWWKTGDLEKIVDSSLAMELSDLTVVVQVTKVLSIALSCTEEDLLKRPTMGRIIKLLSDDNEIENE